ncbi:hypothetical protein [Gemmatimonas sp.]|uniref:hypothetical protein n=1 Tax=Gemmatimonas sp. TaxID=1962908 RepID=UPI003982E429
MAGRFGAAPVLSLTAWSLLGCYAYQPSSEVLPAAPSANVRVTLNPAGSAFVRQSLGNDVRDIEGVVLRRTADSLVLAVERTYTSANERYQSSGDTVTVAVSGTERVDVRKISRSRSLLFGLGIVAAVALALVGIASSVGGASGDGLPSPIQP